MTEHASSGAGAGAEIRFVGASPRTGAPRPPGSADRSPETVTHELTQHPLLALPRLAELAERLPASCVEHNLGAVPSLLPGGVAPRAELSPAEVVLGIETNGCWIVLKHIELDPDYAALLEACVDAVETAVTPDEGRSVRREGFVFLSSPHAMTPAHIDPEHNILLQVRGHKSMSVGRFASDEARDRQCEQLHSGGHRNLQEPPVDVQEHALAPGDGLYVPVHAPHLVQNGPQPSVSLSITWGTSRTLREGRAHGFNARRRGAGRAVSSVGGHGRAARSRDVAKATAQRALLLSDRLLSRRSDG